jgi:hypothetical protein
VRRGKTKRASPRSRRPRSGGLLARADASLLEIMDSLLTKGVVLSGDVVLGVAEVDLIYLRLSVLLCAADRVLGRGVVD